MRGYAGLGGVCHAGGGERGDRASEEEGVPASDSTRRRSGQERPQPGIGGRSRHDASRNTSSASREVTCDLLCLSLSVSLSVCLSPALRLPACLGVISKCSVLPARGGITTGGRATTRWCTLLCTELVLSRMNAVS